VPKCGKGLLDFRKPKKLRLWPENPNFILFKEEFFQLQFQHLIPIMNKLKAALFSLSGLAFSVTTASALSLLDGDFTGATIREGGSITGTSNDGIWTDAEGEAWIQGDVAGWEVNAGEARRLMTVTGRQEHGFAQMVNDGKATTGQQTISFDYEVVAPAGDSTTYQIRYDIVGTNISSPVGENNGKISLENSFDLGTDYTIVGSEILGGLSSTASGNFSETIDFGTGFDYVGIRLVAFMENNTVFVDRFVDIDNVSVVPEPRSYGLLLGLGGLAIVLLQRRLRGS